MEAMCVVNSIVPHLSLFCFDFAGAGVSEGSFVTLGLLEVDDLSTVVKYIEEVLGITRIAFWGRRFNLSLFFVILIFCLVKTAWVR